MHLSIHEFRAYKVAESQRWMVGDLGEVKSGNEKEMGCSLIP